MCVKAWKLHHCNNQMCKATWIPKTQQTAAAFELRLFKTSQWSPSNGKVGREILLFRGWWKTLSMWRKDRAFTCSYLRTENAHSSSPWAMTEGQTAKQVCSPSQKRMARVPQPTPGRLGQPPGDTKLALPSSGSGASLALQRTLPQLSKGFPLPYGGKLSILTPSQPDVKGAPACIL